MIARNITLGCLAYILGLFLTGLPWQLFGIPLGAIAFLLGGILLACLPRSLPHLRSLHPRICLLMGFIGCLAILYFQMRLPQPSPLDISRWADAQKNLPIQVEGKLASTPRLTRNQRLQFELEVTAIQVTANQPPESQPAHSLLYVTVPRSPDPQLYPGRQIRLSGSLYKPKAATNPGGFDFQQYLAQRGMFAGLNGKTLEFLNPSQKPPLLWSLQQRIIQSQRLWIRQGTGDLLSAMVIGRGGVDVAYEIQDQFARVGLAHALAASGTQVSLLTGVILLLTQRLDRRLRLSLGISVLIFYVGLTGLEPSVLRAAVMGMAVFLANTLERKVKPLPLLLLAATVLLLWHPVWIWNLGFQLSFLATLGLVVTVPTLTEWLDGLPPRLTPLVAVPIAAYLWTLPLQLHVFGVVSPYCILINVLTSLLITIISIGGMGSAVLALIHPVLGGATAWILQWPTELFLHIAATVDRLPANGFAIGTISKISVILIYGMYGLIAWQTPFLKRLQKPLQKQWWIAAVISLGLVFIPAYTAAQAFQMTVLSTAENGVMIWRDQGKVGLMNLGSEADVRFAVLPFLKQQGINHVNWAIAPTLTTTEIKQWQQFLQSLPIHLFYAIPASHRIPAKADRISKEKQAKEKANFATAYRQLQQTITAKKGMALTLSHQQKIAGGDLAIAPISLQPVILKFQTHSQTWLYLSRLPYQSLPAADVLWWTGRSTNGRSLTPELLAQVNPQVVITANPLPDATQTWLKTHKTQVFQTAEGAVQWTKSGFRSVGESP